MSDDIPLIFAEDLVAPSAETSSAGRQAIFLSATSAAQMQQYAAAGWAVMAAPGFQGAAPIDLAAVPATTANDIALCNATLVSLEMPTWAPDAGAHFARWAPRVIKVNGAFHGGDDDRAQGAAETLAALGYEILAAHWRDDNTQGIRALSRFERLAAFGAPDWKHINLIAVREPGLVHAILTIARLYVGEERRIAELKIGHAVRGEHIARLEDALMAHQRHSEGRV